MTLIGSVRDFDPDVDIWSSWVERLTHYMEANKFPEEKRVVVFLTTIGARTYDTLMDRLSPDKPKDKTLEELIATLTDHYQPKLLEIAERFRFYSCRQEPGEDVKSFIVVLKKLACTCGFGQGLSVALREWLVMGLAEERMQKHLLTEKDLTFQKVLDIAMTMEMAARDAATLRN